MRAYRTSFGYPSVRTLVIFLGVTLSIFCGAWGMHLHAGGSTAALSSEVPVSLSDAGALALSGGGVASAAPASASPAVERPPSIAAVVSGEYPTYSPQLGHDRGLLESATVCALALLVALGCVVARSRRPAGSRGAVLGWGRICVAERARSTGSKLPLFTLLSISRT